MIKTKFLFFLLLGLLIHHHSAGQYKLREAVQYNIAEMVNQVLVEDLNKDGINEVISVGATIDSGYILIHSNPTIGNMYLIQYITAKSKGGGNINGVVTGDFNHDGRKDIALNLLFSLKIFFQDTNGLFSLNYAQFPFLDERYFLAAGDLNNDGNDDLVTAGLRDSIFVYYQLDDGTFTQQVYKKAISGETLLKIVDINTDGLNDLVIANKKPILIYGAGVFDPFSFAILLQDSISNKLNPPIYSELDIMGYKYVDGMAVGDLNDDGLPDIATTRDSRVHIWYQDTNYGTLFRLNKNTIKLNDADVLEIRDVNNDGKNDIVNISDNGFIDIIQKDSQNQYYKSYTKTVYGHRHPYTTTFSMNDLNNDGLADLTLTYSYIAQPKFFLVGFITA